MLQQARSGPPCVRFFSTQRMARGVRFASMCCATFINRLVQPLGQLHLSSAHDDILVHHPPNHPAIDTLVSCMHIRPTCVPSCRRVVHRLLCVCTCATNTNTIATRVDRGEYSRPTMAHRASDGMESHKWRYEGDEKVRKGSLWS